MATIHLYCGDTPNLKLGPGTTSAQLTEDDDPGREVIIFHNGFAAVDTEKLPNWEKWVQHPGTPYIEILGADDQDMAEIGEGLPCEICAKTDRPRQFKNKRALAMHLQNHRRDRVKMGHQQEA